MFGLCGRAMVGRAPFRASGRERGVAGLGAPLAKGGGTARVPGPRAPRRRPTRRRRPGARGPARGRRTGSARLPLRPSARSSGSIELATARRELVDRADWANTTVVRHDPAEAVRR
jgi:hypothetical protein